MNREGNISNFITNKIRGNIEQDCWEFDKLSKRIISDNLWIGLRQKLFYNINQEISFQLKNNG